MATQVNPTVYPAGFAGPLVVKGVPIVQMHPGLVWWLSNNASLPSIQGGVGTNTVTQRVPFVSGSDGNPGTWSKPFATLKYALSVANPGDIIMVKPYHAETLTGAAAVTMSTKNVAVVGTGTGGARPTFSLATAATTIAIAANDLTLQNLVFIGAAASTFVATCFNVANAQVATDLTIDRCEFRDKDTTHGFVAILTGGTTNNILDGLTFTNNRVIGLLTSPGAGTTAIVSSGATGAINRAVITGNTILHRTSIGSATTPMLLAMGGNDLTNSLVQGNVCTRPDTAASQETIFDTSSTNWIGTLIADNYGGHLSGATGLIGPTGTKAQFINNYCMITGAADKSALINPAAV